MKCFSSFSLLLLLVVFSACDKSNPAPVPVQAVRFNDLPADPATTFDANTGAPIGGFTNKFTFFSFVTGKVVDNPSGTNWDMAFRATTILINGGTSGPGQGAAQVLNGIFNDLSTAPTDGYKQDNDAGGLNPAGVPNANLAIPTGSGNGWYTSTGGGIGSPSVITATAGKVLMIRTADGKYAKMEILSYYKGAPATVNPLTDAARYYTFQYVYQPDGSTRLK
ncbi:MAG: HmuY family protein [Bacteroidota bacterium]|nr:HmuY family protein [Cytophagales bacterium]